MSWYAPRLDGPTTSEPTAPTSAPSASSESVLSPTSAGARNGPRHADLLQHFQSTLSRLVTCSGDSGGFSAFTDLADRSTSLYLSILAWAGRHMANMGAARYEAISERLGAEAGVMVLAELEKVAQPGSAGAMDDEDAMTVLATALMVMQFRVGGAPADLMPDLPRRRVGIRRACRAGGVSRVVALRARRQRAQRPRGAVVGSPVDLLIPAWTI